MARPAEPTRLAKTSVCAELSSPRGSGRPRVRAIVPSIFCSTRQLIAAAAPAASAMPIVPNSTALSGGQPGVARNMPMTAVNTISVTTRGFVSERNWRARRNGPWLRTREVMRRSRKGGDFTTSGSPDPRGLEQPLEVFRHPLDVGIDGVAQHDVAQRIDDVDAVRACAW